MIGLAPVDTPSQRQRQAQSFELSVNLLIVPLDQPLIDVAQVTLLAFQPVDIFDRGIG